MVYNLFKIFPRRWIKLGLRWILKMLYRVEVTGLEHYEKAGPRTMIMANHISFIDAALLTAFLPDPLTFAVDSYILKTWWMRPLLPLIEALPLDFTYPLGTKILIDRLRDNKRVMIFPEGRITTTGSLMKIYEGAGIIADKADANILPIQIDGPQYTHFSKLKGIIRRRFFPKIRLTILPPKKLNLPETLENHARQEMILSQLHNIMAESAYRGSDYKQPLFEALLKARKIYGGKHLIIEDIHRQPLIYNSFITRTFILGAKIEKLTKKDENVGVLLPNMTSTAVTFFALQATGRTPAMLNFSIGSKILLSACRTAEVTNILTTKQFVEKAKLKETIEVLAENNIKIHYLEDIAKGIHLMDKLKGLMASWVPHLFYKGKNDSIDNKAVVLFTSGSEGEPKGVVLSHRNIRANTYQLCACIDFNPKDRIFNALPVFHSFGMSVGMLLPIFGGIKTFLYPSPLDYRMIPEMVYETRSTILFGTDTFLSAYARFAHPYDFSSLRYVFAGAEKLQEQTRLNWLNQFGVRIFQGYGVTETSPVLSMNTPMHNKHGTVGRLAPGIDYRIELVEGIEPGGKLLVRGENIMLGYLLSTHPGQLAPPKDGWHDTGDVVEIDEEGFIIIKGRAKRFAKVGGEMISLAAVEAYLKELWPEEQHVLASIPDPKKGEQLVLVTNYPKANRQEIANFLSKHGLSSLSIPKTIIIVENIPILGSGKIDYAEVQSIAENEN